MVRAGLIIAAGGIVLLLGAASCASDRSQDETAAPRLGQARASVVVAAEKEIDQPVTGSPASGDQFSPTIVSAGQGKGYLAVWFDRRGIRPLAQ